MFGACYQGDVKCGNPIDIGSGNKFEQITDYATAAGENKLTFTRFYNSLGTAQTFAKELGRNWRSTYDRYLSIGSTTALVVERPDGQALNFVLNNGAWTSDTDVDLRLIQTGSGTGSTWTLTDRNDTVETYTTISTSEAILTKIQSRNGYTQTLQYDSNHLIAVLDSFGRSLQFTYQNGLLQSLTTPDGLVLTYSYNSSGVTPGVNDRLASVAYSTSPQTSQTYLYENSSSPFAMTGIIDENGNRFATWTYDASGRATSSQHAGGADLTQVVYNDTDGSRTVTNALGQQEIYKFTTLQDVPKVTEIDRLATATTAAATRTLTYDANGYTASQTDWNGNLTSYVNDAHGQPTSITEASGAPQARTTTLTYDPNFHLPTKIVEPGLTTDFIYDASGNLLTKNLTDTTTTTIPYSTNGTKRTWTYTWGANGLLASVKGPRTDVNELTSYSYDGSGTLVATTNALGQQIRVTQHTGGGLPQTVIDPNSVTTQLSYDARLRLKTSTVTVAQGPAMTTYAYDAAGNLLSTTLPDGSALINGYDAAHRFTSVKDLFGQKAAYTLDALGNKTQTAVSNAANVVKRSHSSSFDALGRLLQDTGGAGQVTTHAYDGNGNALTITDPLNRVTKRAFDPLNRLIKVTDPAGGIATTSFDAHDRPLSVMAPNGATTTYVYDGFGDLIQTTSPDTGKTVYRYDLAGNLAQKTDATGATANNSYDALDRIITTAFPADPAENVAYTYDQALGVNISGQVSVTTGGFARNRATGNWIATMTVANSGSAAITGPVQVVLTSLSPNSTMVNGSGTLGGSPYITATSGTLAPGATVSVSIEFTNPSNGFISFTPVAYAGAAASSKFSIGRLIGVTDAAGTLNLSYDERGNTLSAKRTHGAASLLTSYGYDAASRIASTTYPSGWTVAYARNAMGQVIDMRAKAPASVTLSSVVSSVGYQPFGPVNGLKFGNGVTETRSFDLDYRMTGIAAAGNTTVQGLNYGFDAADNVLSIADSVTPTNSQNFGYDVLDRLTGATGGYGAFGYTYDPVGNRLTQKLGAATTAYAYTAQTNRLASIATGGATQTVGYTAAGNINSFSPASGSTASLVYNQAGRLAAASNSAAQPVMQYTYDAFGHRLVKVGAATATTLFQYDQSGHLLEENDGQGHAQVDYIYLDGRPVATLDPAGKKLYFLHDDRLGTPQVATDANQTITWSASYQPFGYTSTGAGLIVQDLRLPGQEFEIETGWNHNGFRDYSPALGRYLESDPIGLLGGTNTYSFVGGNPHARTDRMGLFAPSSITAVNQAESVAQNGVTPSIGPVEVALGLWLIAADAVPAVARIAWGALNTVRQCVSQPASELQTPQKLLMPGGEPIGQLGNGPDVRIVQDPLTAEKLFAQLTVSGTPNTPKNYPGVGYDLPNGGWAGYRPVSKSGPSTIDVSGIPGVDFSKIKFPQ